jgi:predicted amidohydrolase YtcJ
VSEGLLIRNAEVEGRAGLDVRIEAGRVAEIGAGLRASGETLDARGGALIPGLIDHHIHILATAAQADSLALEGAATPQEMAALVSAFAATRPNGSWLRATGYHDRIAGVLDRDALDRLAPHHPLRVQHQTGSLWMLNSAALALVDSGEGADALERDAAGRATGRLWRGDRWLRARIGDAPPPLRPLGERLARHGLTGLTDASVGAGPEAAALLADAHRRGALPQRLNLMSGGPLAAPEDGAIRIGPLKILLDDHALPDWDEMIGRIALARALGRPVAVHCVTAGELALTLAAFDAAGARAGDRIEHGGVIDAAAVPVIRRLGLTVVTQSAFVFERGDRYLADVDPAEQGDLYRCASLLAAGVAVAGSSDAPYADPDPWAAMRAAVARRTRRGAAIGLGERITPATALGLYLGRADDPGGAPRRVETGAVADLCLLREPLAEALAALSGEGMAGEGVAATLVGGRVVYPA